MRVRRHVVTLTVATMALATGIALGGGPLSDTGIAGLTAGRGPDPARTDDDPAVRDTAFADAFATTGARRLYQRGLAERRVAVVTLPGADKAVVAALAGEVQRAGGTVTATYAVRPGLVAPGEKSLVEEMGSQLVAQLGPGSAERRAPTYERMGQLVGRSIASERPRGAPTDRTAASVAQSLEGAGLLAAPGSLPRRAPLVLVVTGGTTGDELDDDVLTGLLAGLAGRARGVVAVGPTASGDLDAVRSERAARRVATVDGVETGLGRVSAVLTLIRSRTTPGGSFGASGADGAAPLG